MANAPELTGPDLSAGIDVSELAGECSASRACEWRRRHVGAQGRDHSCGQCDLHSLLRAARGGSRGRGDGALSLASRLFRFAHGRGARCAGAGADRLLRSSSARRPGLGRREAVPIAAPRPANLSGEIVIVGAGAAGAVAAEKLRRLGYAGPIALIGNEAPGPVDRPNLSKDFLAGNAPMEWVRLRDDEFYEKLKIEFIRATGRRARYRRAIGHAQERTQDPV